MADDEARMEAARNGEALPDGSYPTRDCDELGETIAKFEREAQQNPEVRRYLIHRAVKLGCTGKLPDEWEAPK